MRLVSVYLAYACGLEAAAILKKRGKKKEALAFLLKEYDMSKIPQGYWRTKIEDAIKELQQADWKETQGA